MNMRNVSVILALFAFMVSATTLDSQTSTPVIVRVQAHDAKLIGTSMGGVEIAIRDHASGELLAIGQTEGGTGNTDLLVLDDKARYGEVSTPGSAAFQTVLDLAKPVFAEITATFRNAYTGHPVTMSQTHWFIPGKEMTGDGIVFDMAGFAMRIQHPLPHQPVSLSDGNDARIDLFMIMLCGCPISPGGTWDSGPMEVEAMVYEGEKMVNKIPFTNVKTNLFTVDLSGLKPGSYRIFVTAYDPRSKNTGVEQVDVAIRE